MRSRCWFRSGARVLGLGLLLGGAGCGLVDLPDVSLTPAPEAVIEDRVWLDTDPGAPSGSFRAFLSDGTMIFASCVETYRLAPWRRVDGTNLVWEEDGQVIQAEIAVLGPKDLGLVLTLGAAGETMTQRFRAAEAPVVCPDMPR